MFCNIKCYLTYSNAKDTEAIVYDDSHHNKLYVNAYVINFAAMIHILVVSMIQYVFVIYVQLSLCHMVCYNSVYMPCSKLTYSFLITYTTGYIIWINYIFLIQIQYIKTYSLIQQAITFVTTNTN